jgi:ABC-type multidrug transport system ATPase subunit
VSETGQALSLHDVFQQPVELRLPDPIVPLLFIDSEHLAVVHCSSMLEVNGLTKSYGKLMAVSGVSFRADHGETIGLLGPNGAGKTTTVSIIAGLLRPDSGEVLIEGKQVKSDTDPVKLKIGLVPQDMALYDQLSARDNLTFLRRFTRWPARKRGRQSTTL